MRARHPLSILPLVLMCAGSLSSACARPAVDRSLVLEVENDLGRTISEIRRKGCGDLDVAFAPMDDSQIEAGEQRRFALPATCLDLIAYDERGQVVGEQRGLRMLPHARWVLRR